MSTQSELEAQLIAIDSLIMAKLAGGVVPNWRVGDVSFNEADSVDVLIKFKESILKQLRETPSEVIDSALNAVDVFGSDGTEYKGDEF